MSARHNLDYMVDMLDWDKNVDPCFVKNRFRNPVPVEDISSMHEKGYEEKWVVYGSEYFAAKELVIFPKRSVKVKDPQPYGIILLEGYGTIENMPLECPYLTRFHQVTRDEYFVSFKRAREGVTITNLSDCENLVLLKGFGPGNSSAP